MDANRGGSTAAVIAKLTLVIVGFGLLAWLSARQMVSHPVIVCAIAGGLTGAAAVGLLVVTGLMHILNGEVVRAHGALAALGAVASSMLMLLPFAVLALIAELALGWQAVQAFASAGIMVGAAGIGGEMARLGPPRALNTLVPLGAGGLFAGAWVVFGALVQGVTG